MKKVTLKELTLLTNKISDILQEFVFYQDCFEQQRFDFYISNLLILIFNTDKMLDVKSLTLKYRFYNGLHRLLKLLKSDIMNMNDAFTNDPPDIVKKIDSALEWFKTSI